MIKVTARQRTPETVAREINRYVQENAADGFVFAPHLQEWGVYRKDCAHGTLSGNLGLRSAA
ncbi:hypothetical protein ACRQ1B_24480 [Rhizobium panacihumi]|uniref:hypothetical protein n=1 Tax=Rhizobium panacihumi TaxID=2008450 RepID=UPI003D79906F